MFAGIKHRGVAKVRRLQQAEVIMLLPKRMRDSRRAPYGHKYHRDTSRAYVAGYHASARSRSACKLHIESANAGNCGAELRKCSSHVACSVYLEGNMAYRSLELGLDFLGPLILRKAGLTGKRTGSSLASSSRCYRMSKQQPLSDDFHMEVPYRLL